MTKKLIFLLREPRFIQRAEPLLQVHRRKIWLYLALQTIGVVAPVAISLTIAAIGFPVLVCLLIPFRWIWMPRWFSVRDLEIMDDLTANNRIVLASLGGAPKLPANTTMDDYGLERRFSTRSSGAMRQRAGNYHI